MHTTVIAPAFCSWEEPVAFAWRIAGFVATVPFLGRFDFNNCHAHRNVNAEYGKAHNEHGIIPEPPVYDTAEEWPYKQCQADRRANPAHGLANLVPVDRIDDHGQSDAPYEGTGKTLRDSPHHHHADGDAEAQEYRGG